MPFLPMRKAIVAKATTPDPTTAPKITEFGSGIVAILVVILLVVVFVWRVVWVTVVDLTVVVVRGLGVVQKLVAPDTSIQV
jgi:hypothetical protein